MIDGQQRLATLAILVAALRDRIIELGWNASPTQDYLNDSFLKNKHASGNQGYKLVLRRTDNATLHALVNGEGPNIAGGATAHRIIGAYEFFREQLIEAGGNTLSEICNSIASLRIVEVTLHRDVDDPQAIFEVLNNTGVDLSQGDLIRNYLLMGLIEEQQNALYMKYWNIIEGYFRSSDGKLDDGAFGSFLQDYVSLKREDRGRVPSNRVYDEFQKSRDAIQRTGSTLDELMEDIRRFACYYARFMGYQTIPSTQLANAMHNLRRRGTTPTVLIMQLYDCYHSLHTLTEEGFIQVLGLIESYLLRRAVIGFQTRWGSYWSIFADIARKISHEPLEPAHRVQNELKTLDARRWQWRFPMDEEFSAALQERDMYQLGPICKYLLGRLENDQTREPSPVGTYTIEHIMPQTLTPAWREMLGEGCEDIHHLWLHRLGNLTLTAYNQMYSNRPFEEKKKIHGGFNDSAVRLNKFVRAQSKWTSHQMEERGKDLSRQALAIWLHPQQESRVA